MLLEIPRYKIAPIIDTLYDGARINTGIPGTLCHLSEEGVPFYKDKRPESEDVAVIVKDGKFFWDIAEGYYRSAPLNGRPFIHKVFDCYQFLRDYYQRELNITLPDYEYQDEWWVLGENKYLDLSGEAGFVPVAPPLQAGDVIVMQINSPVVNHSAVYVGDGQIAHHLGGQRSRTEPFRRGWLRNVKGYYRHEGMS